MNPRLTSSRVLIFCLLLLLSCRPSRDKRKNDEHLETLEAKLDLLSHPPQTEKKARRSSIGVCGNGNHCDFFAGMIRSYEGDFKTVVSFYENLQLNGVNVRRITDTNNITYCEHNTLSEWGLEAGTDSLYLVYFFENREANSDMRCH